MTTAVYTLHLEAMTILSDKALFYFTGCVSSIQTGCVIIGFHQPNSGSPMLTQQEFKRTYRAITGEDLQ